MKPIPLFAAALFLAGGSTALVSATTTGGQEETGAAVADPAKTQSEYESLLAEFTAAQARFKSALKSGSKEERRALRKAAPVKTFWERFAALGEKGDGLAMLWMIDNVRDNRDIRSKDRGDVIAPLYAKLFANHTGEDWFTSVLSSLARDSKYVSPEKSLEFYEQAIEGAKNDDVAAAALYMAARSVGKSNPEKASEYIDRILADYANTVYGTAARAMKSKPEESEVGEVAPTFIGKTIDGFQFSLEDYRGKVVVLDFYGFW